MKFTVDALGRKVTLPKAGDQVLRDGYTFTVTSVEESDDIYIIASVNMRGSGGCVGVGYYDYLKHEKA